MLTKRLSSCLLCIGILISCCSNNLWGQQKEQFKNEVEVAVNYLQQGKALEADSIFSLLDDNKAVLLDSMERAYYYLKGLAKCSAYKINDAIPYFEKAKILTDSLKIFDLDYLNLNNLLSDCLLNQKEYNKAEANLRSLVVKHNDLLEKYPEQAAYSYNILSNLYVELGDSLLAESIHYDKIQFYLIKAYQQENPDNPVGQKVLDSFNLTKTVMNDYYSYTRSIDQEYIKNQIGSGMDMEEIGADSEAVWFYENSIRNANNHLGKYNIAQKWAYLNLLKLYASNKEFDAFSSLLPIAIDYINHIKDDEKDNKDNEFALGKVYGNIFKEQGDYEEAYKCYMICKRYLESGKSIEDQYDQEIRLYLSMSSTCLNLSLYNDALAYCDSTENKITTNDKAHEYHLYWARMNRGMTFVRMGNYDRANEQLELLKQNTIKDIGIYSTNYIEVCVWKGMNFILQEKYTDAIKELSPLIEHSDNYNELWSGYEINAYSLLASAYMGALDYKSALEILEKLANMEIHKNGKVSDNTKELINECKTKL